MFRCQTEMAQYLDNIHAKPSYYAGYYLRTVLGGSLGKMVTPLPNKITRLLLPILEMVGTF
jgi:hypothetical protein